MDDLLFVLDKHGIFTGFYQPGDREVLYTKPKQFLGSSFNEVMPENVSKLISEAWADLTQTKSVQDFDYPLHVSEQERWFNVRLSPILNDSNEIEGATAVVRDVTARKQTEKKMATMARIDPLTGISNRRDFNDRFATEIARFNRNQKSFTVILGDIDLFKKVNDAYGHDCGDFVLVKTAKLMTESLRAQDALARWGGEEFIMLLPETETRGGVATSEKIRKRIATCSFSYKNEKLHISMSFGVSTFGANTSMEAVIESADRCLYKAKLSGRNCVVAE